MLLFSVGIGSKGTDVESYSVRLPFTLSPATSIDIAEGGKFDILGHASEISLERNHFVLTVTGFYSERDASVFLSKICAGFLWTGLNCSVGFRFDANATPVHLLDHPVFPADKHIAELVRREGWPEVDGFYDATETIIRPEHKKLTVWGGGSVEGRSNIPVSILSQSICEGVATGNPEFVMQDPKVRLACEVYLSSHFENSQQAIFLTRITALEALVEDMSSSDSILGLVDQFINAAKDARSAKAEASLREEYESLESRLARLRSRSIKSGIREKVRESLRNDAEAKDPDEIAREISKLYDLRSDLVHSGCVDPQKLSRGNVRLAEIVPKVLRSCFRAVAE